MLLTMTLAGSLAAAQDVRAAPAPAPTQAAEPAAAQGRRTTPQARAAAAAGMADEESAEKIAEEAQRDLRESRFYNRPGATRAQYNEEWQTCRLIARGSTTPSGSTPVYVPPGSSVLAAGIGGGIGGAIAQAIIEGRLRRANRRQCLLIRGWNLVEVDEAEEARIAAMTDAQRDDFFNTIVGAADVGGRKVRRWNNDYAAPRLAPAADQGAEQQETDAAGSEDGE
ncbi:MAG TPA: hypothetical protein VGB79_07785 [Allosphingosinicella sp.]|jgi:hypothetical protein